MLNSVEELEGIASSVHDDLGMAPVDAFAIAEYLGLRCAPWSKGHAVLSGDVIRHPVPPKARPTRVHGLVAHEAAHALMREEGMAWKCEPSARYLAGALMLPRDPFARDMARTGWDLHALRELHPNASAEMIVVRMTQLSQATAWVWDNGRLARQYGIDEADVSEYVDRVLTVEEPVIDGAIGAWPVFDRHWRRVIVLKKSA